MRKILFFSMIAISLAIGTATAQNVVLTVSGHVEGGSSNLHQVNMPVNGTNSLKVVITATSTKGTGCTMGYRLRSKTGELLQNNTFGVPQTGSNSDTTIYRKFLLDTCYIEPYDFNGGNAYPKDYTLTCYENPQIHSDTENNDDIAAALPVTWGETVHGLIGFTQHTQGQYKVDEKDFYKVAMPLDGTNSLKMTFKAISKREGGGWSLGYRLWSKTGERLDYGKQVDMPGGENGTTVETVIFRKYLIDTCYVEVWRLNTEVEYELIFEENPQIHSDAENNDDIAAALPVTWGETVHGLIGFTQHTQGQYKVDEKDFYKVAMPLDGTNSLKMTFKAISKREGGGWSLGYRLWSKTGERLDYGKQVDMPGGENGTTVETVIFRKYLIDTCYVEVWRLNTEVEYELIFEENPQIHSDAENNDDISLAMPLNEGETAHGLIGFSQHTQEQYKIDKKDFYKITFAPQPPDAINMPKITVKSTSKREGGGHTIGYRIYSTAGQQLALKNIDLPREGSRTDSWVYTDSLLNACYIEIWDMNTDGAEYELFAGNENYQAGFETVRYNNTVNMVNKSNGLTFDWDFGDGTPVIHAKTPSHTYTQAGVFEIKQTAHFILHNVDLSVEAKDTVTIAGIDSYLPKVIGNSGNSSIVIFGGGIDENLNVSLVQGTTSISATSITNKTIGQVAATFTGNIPNGIYDLHVTQAGLVDTIFAGGITVEGIIYPKVISQIEASNAFMLRSGFNSNSYLVLQNTGNVDALGVNAYIAAPEDIDITLNRKDFRELVDTVQNFNFYCSEFGQNISISNSKIVEYMDLLKYDVVPVTSVYNRPFAGKVYQIYVPKVPAGGTVRIPFKIKSTSQTAHQIQTVISSVETMTAFNPELETDTVVWGREMILTALLCRFITIMDPALQQNTDNDTWLRTLSIANKIMQKILANDCNHVGYVSETSELLDNNFYDYGIVRKQLATLMLTLETIAENNSTAQRSDGIFNFAYTPSNNSIKKLSSTAGQTDAERKVDQVVNASERIYNGNRNNSSDPFANFANNAWQWITDHLPFPSSANEGLNSAVTAIHSTKIRNDKYTNGWNYLNGEPDAQFPGYEPWMSNDPNDITGPFGINNERYVGKSQQMGYVIRFENKADAGLPAMFVNVYDTLDVEKYDLNTFELSNITIGDTIIEIPAGRKSYITEYDMRPAKDYIVSISAALNEATGIVHWNFVTLDPATRDMITDLEGGFLPPNVDTPEGEGSVAFSVKLKEGLPHKSEVSNSATILFDYNEPIATNVWTNTLDLSAPTSSAVAVALNDSTFKVVFTAQDDENGVRYKKLYVAINGSEFFHFGTFFAEDEIAFKADTDTLYSFYTVAVDMVGNEEQKTASAETSIVLSSTSISTPQTASEALRVYVANDELRILNYAEGAVQIFDAMGRAMLNRQLSDGQSIDVSHLPAGMYFLKVGAQTAKFIKK